MRHWRRWLLLFSVVFFVVMNRESTSQASAPTQPIAPSIPSPQQANAP